ncbi:MAG TPA: alpha-ribazole phosphatase [Patescibacteria group bacterium]|nr:alpha-ribazole phosphatase [Patescibacteria group bacterium]
MEDMTKVILVRHGQTLWNQERKYQGHSDVALSDLGRKQAELAAERLSREKLDAAYSSDLSRAAETAACIAARHGVPVTTLPALREIMFGEWEGLNYDQITARWPQALEKLWARPSEVVIPGGESFAQVQERAYGAVKEIIARHQGENVLITAHGGTIGVILCAALGMDLDHVWSIRQDNTAVNILEYFGERVQVSLLNDSHHLKDL